VSELLQALAMAVTVTVAVAPGYAAWRDAGYPTLREQ